MHQNMFARESFGKKSLLSQCKIMPDSCFTVHGVLGKIELQDTAVVVICLANFEAALRTQVSLWKMIFGKFYLVNNYIYCWWIK